MLRRSQQRHLFNLDGLIWLEVCHRLRILPLFTNLLSILTQHLLKFLFVPLRVLIVLDLSVNLLDEVPFLMQMEDQGVLSIALYSFWLVQVFVYLQVEVAYQLFLVAA